MSEHQFAFVFHPINAKEHATYKYPVLGRLLPEPVINWACQFVNPLYISHITGLVSHETQRETQGCFLAVPYTTTVMHQLPAEKVYQKVIAAGRMAEELGAKVFGLGAHVAVVGDAGVTIDRELDLAVTTGNRFTVGIAVDAMLEAARVMDTDIGEASVAIVGATGAIGKACAQMLAEACAELILVGRREEATKAIAETCTGQRADVCATTNINDIYHADLVLTVSSAIDAIIEPQHLKPGAVVLDVARPRDVSVAVARERDDVLVIEGGMVEVPGDHANFNFYFGFPERRVFACMAETIAMAMEGDTTSSVGRDIPIDDVKHISAMCKRHGFQLAGFRAFEHAVTQDTIDSVREKAFAKRKLWSPAY